MVFQRPANKSQPLNKKNRKKFFKAKKYTAKRLPKQPEKIYS